MRRARPLLSALTLAVTALSLFVSSSALAASAPASGGDLFVLQTGGGSLTAKKLVLRGVDPEVTSFTDRPQRSAGSVKTARFAAGWTRTFGSVPPNAALVVQGAPADRDCAVLELSHPRYRADTRTLTYSVHRLTKTGAPDLAEFDRRADGDAVKGFGPASLFIDSGNGAPAEGRLEVFVPSGSTLSLEFEGGTTYPQGGPTLEHVSTPAPSSGSTSSGSILLSGRRMTFAADASGAGMNVTMRISVGLFGGGFVSGGASIPAGGHASFLALTGERAGWTFGLTSPGFHFYVGQAEEP